MARTSWIPVLLLTSCVTTEDELVSLDRDRDGWLHSAAADLGEPGPFDCDDDDASVHPDAVEICDGNDQDCDGAADPAGTTWYRDQDGDAFGDLNDTTEACAQPSGYVETSGDCDDGAELVFPGAVEVWYDGTDQNCDNASDFDQDGDGADALAHGGADCDDLDALAAPALEEICGDHVDNDCDGAHNNCRLTGTLLVSASADARLLNDCGAKIRVGELTGDGILDLVSAGCSTLLVFPGPFSGTVSASTAVATIDTAPHSVYALDVGDLDGDDQDDLVVGARETQLVLTFAGPLTGDFVVGHARAAIQWPEADGYHDFGWAVLAGEDFDGDGRPDLAVSATFPTSGTEHSGVYVFPGEISGAKTVASAKAKVSSSDEWEATGSALGRVGDLDGDGTDDLLVAADAAGSSESAAMIASGPLLGDVDLRDGFGLVASTGRVGSSVAPVAADADGDGVTDLLIGASDTSAGAGAAHLLVGPVVATHATGDTVFTSHEAGARVGAAVALADIDGDGIADAILGANESNAGGPASGAVYIFYGPLTEPAYSTASADLVLEGDAGRGLGGAIQAQDLDGDRYAEIILAQNGTIWVISGQGR